MTTSSAVMLFERITRPLPRRQRQRLRVWTRPAWLHRLRRTRPLSPLWGYDRGLPIDRYYIEGFLREHRGDITGRVLEIRDSRYTHRFGTDVTRRHVVDLDRANEQATIITDLTALGVRAGQFDCFVLTQTLQYIYDTRAALLQAHSVLRPGGVLLVTVPSISRITPGNVEGDYWRFTAASCRALFAEAFGPGQVTVRSYGNVLTAMGFLNGLATQELTRAELDAADPYFPVIVAVRAVKASD